MKVLNIIQGTDLGGMERASLRLMIQFKKNGHVCEVISLNSVGALGELLEKEKINVLGIPYKGFAGWRGFFSLKMILKKSDADMLIMTGHHFLSMLALGKLCKGKRILAMHFHHEGVKPKWVWRIIYKVAIVKFDAITFPSDFIRKEAEEILPSIKSKSYLINNPIDFRSMVTKEQKENSRVSLGLPIDAFIVGNAGWLIDRKRFDIFLEVAKVIISKNPSVIFVIAGDGPLHNFLHSLIELYDIKKNVKFLGWVTNMDQFYQCLDVLLFNSDWDALGLTPLEAMSNGVPVVASVKNGGLKEIISDERFGFLNNNHDIDYLVNKIEILIANPKLALNIAHSAHHKIHQIADPGAIAQQTLNLINLNL